MPTELFYVSLLIILSQKVVCRILHIVPDGRSTTATYFLFYYTVPVKGLNIVFYRKIVRINHIFFFLRDVLQLKKIGYWTPIYFVVLVIREYTRYMDKINEKKCMCRTFRYICCVGTWSRIFDVITVLDSSTFLFCVVRFLFKKKLFMITYKHIKKVQSTFLMHYFA